MLGELGKRVILDHRTSFLICLKAFFLVGVFQWKRMNGSSPCRSSKIQIATLHNTCVGGLERIWYWVCVSVCMNKLRTTLQRQKESSLLDLNTTGSNMKTYCVKTVAKIDHLIVFIHLIFVIILQKKNLIMLWTRAYPYSDPISLNSPPLSGVMISYRTEINVTREIAVKRISR